MQFEVAITGIAELMARCRAVGANAQPLTNAAVAKVSFEIQRDIRAEAPHRTGALQRSVLVENMGDSAAVSANEKYAIYVEKGTDPHVIVPVKKKALFWKGALHPVAMVNHPGTKANPFFKRGLDKAQPYIDATFGAVRASIIAQLAERGF